MPVEEPLAQLSFDLEEALGQRRLRDAERLGRLAEARVLDQGEHVPVVAQFHVVLPGYDGDNPWKNVAPL